MKPLSTLLVLLATSPILAQTDSSNTPVRPALPDSTEARAIADFVSWAQEPSNARLAECIERRAPRGMAEDTESYSRASYYLHMRVTILAAEVNRDPRISSRYDPNLGLRARSSWHAAAICAAGARQPGAGAECACQR
jgi:hypothetical protein